MKVVRENGKRLDLCILSRCSFVRKTLCSRWCDASRSVPCGSSEGQARRHGCESRGPTSSDRGGMQKPDIIASFPSVSFATTICIPSPSPSPARLYDPQYTILSTNHNPRSLIRTTLAASHLHAILIPSALRAPITALSATSPNRISGLRPITRCRS
jgi:hypothetical protein